MPITQEEANIINGAMPALQINQPVGNLLKEAIDEVEALQAAQVYETVGLKLAVVADASAGINFVMPAFDLEIVDVVVQCTASNVAGTLQVRRLTTPVTDAMICAVADAVVRMGTIDVAERLITAGETLNILANGAADRGILFITAIRR